MKKTDFCILKLFDKVHLFRCPEETLTRRGLRSETLTRRGLRSKPHHDMRTCRLEGGGTTYATTRVIALSNFRTEHARQPRPRHNQT
ncbi:hypothetical protein RRG08_065135 [Elysia crispata]|uniref:Uncharacterized protein n=1 Tax=Elysia crispata TaxID=231223 RepID=A0AAE0Z9I5_9GAST|nr:hypothetical protein RRG08_065135 [Elysia crispata]